MPTITAIKAAVKTAGRYNIFVDDKYSFSLSENQVIDLGIRKNLELDEARLSELQQASIDGKAYARAIELLARRPRSVKEMRDYAKRKQWGEDTTLFVIQKLERLGLLNDEAFAAFWVRARASGSKSKRHILLELRQKGVTSDVAEQILADNEDVEDNQALQKLIEKKSHRYDDERKLIAYLMSKGFSYDDVRDALNAVNDQSS